MNTKLCILVLVLLMCVSPALAVVWPKTYTIQSVTRSYPTVGNDADEICELGEKEAWFGFDISAIHPVEEIVSASLTALMIDYGDPTQRTLWYDWDDDWILSRTDPENKILDELVGTVVHQGGWAFVTIDIDVSLHNWADDLADGYVTLMLTGPLNGGHRCGAVDFRGAVLELVTIPSEEDYSGPPPNFGLEEIIQADGRDIVVTGYSVPSFEDWNNDNLKDLIVGEGGGTRGDGKVRVYINVGTEAEPQFFDYFYAQSNGSDLICPASGCLGCFPRVVYWDADERKDLLIGLSDGTVKIYLNTGTDKDPMFDEGTLIKLGDRKNIDVGNRATPSVVDWNNDGLKDLAVGAYDGEIHIFLNEGTDTEPVFLVEAVAQDVNGDTLIVSNKRTSRASPVIVDLDYDGNKDILTGNTDGKLLFYSNVGNDEEPVFSGYTEVESNGAPINLGKGARSRPFVCFWTGDGLFGPVDAYADVLIGAADGKVRLYRGIPVEGDTNGDGEINDDDEVVPGKDVPGKEK